MEAADLMRDTHRRSRHLSAESYPHTIRAGRLDARSSLLHLLLPMACKGGRAVRCADRILCLSSPPELDLRSGNILRAWTEEPRRRCSHYLI